MMGKTNSVTRKALTWDATATANSLLYGHTAYGADGTKLTGAGAYWQYVRQLRDTFNGAGASLPSEVKIYSPLSNNMYSTFIGCTNLVTLHLTVSDAVVTWRDTFNKCNSLQTINGVLNFGRAGTDLWRIFLNCYALVNVTIAPSSIKAEISLANSPLLSTASLLSIANGLDAATPATLTMHATSKTNMNNIMVDSVDGTAVLGSTMSLTTFITTIKGWTIA